jgi:hypothetical protein
MFNSNSINASDCLDKGEFIITSNTSIEIKKELQFNIRVSYPGTFMTECSIR